MMTLYIIGFVVVFLLVLASGMPVGFGLGFLGMGLLTALDGMDGALSVSMEKAYQAMDSSILVSIPLFVLAAQLIGESGMGKRLFDAAKTFLGRFKAGLGMSTVVSSGLFSAMTGSSFVAASTMGLIAIPELKKAKYPDFLTSAAITSGGSLGAIIPPSIILIIYGYLTDESIGKLFAAGMVPGIILVVLYSLSMIVFSKYIGKAGADEREADAVAAADASGQEIVQEEPERVMTKWVALKEAFWGLMAPVIILGGIYGGIFTATEAAAVAVIYCTLVGFFIYRTLDFKKLWAILQASGSVSCMIAMIVIGGAILAYPIVYGRIPQMLIELIIAKNFNPWLLLFLINVILFALGMFVEILALVYLAIPLCHPVVLHMGWDNIWFAIIFLLNVNLALITPPMGGVLFIVSQIGGIPLNRVIKGALIPIAVIIFVLLLIVFFPGIATWLPSIVE